jgi:hypothetical protein
MKKTREFDNILNECLERLLKGATVEQCLAWYPEQAAELEPLLRTARDAKEAAAIKPRPEFRERAGYQFQAALREIELKRSRGFFSWQPRWVAAVVVVIVLMAGSGTVAASGNSLPDEPLYTVKLATEAVRLKLTPSAQGRAELYVKLADTRVAEIIKMADKGKTEQVEQTAQRLNAALIAMTSLAAPGGEESEESQVNTFGAEQLEQEVPGALMAPAPTPALAPPIEGTSPPAVEAPLQAAPKAPVPPEDIGRHGGGGKGKGIGVEKQAELKKLLSRRAVENLEALEAALDRAPESAKPALRRAIEEANAGYEEALGHLD